jgi:hypothetical protein
MEPHSMVKLWGLLANLDWPEKIATDTLAYFPGV